MSSSCGKRNREKGRSQNPTYLEVCEWLCVGGGLCWEEGKGFRLLLLRGLNSKIEFVTAASSV